MQAVTTMGLLRNPRFDVFFIVGIPVIAIASGLLVTYDNNLFMPILIADLWILGYHHVISTYTRLAFDKQSLIEHKALVFYLLPAVAVAVMVMGVSIGPWAITTTYLYWQWWHYTRQSEGISKAYAAKSKDKQLGNPLIRRAAFYAVPIAGILAASHRSPSQFLFVPVKTLPVADIVLTAVYIVTAFLLVLWLVEQVKAYLAGKLAVPYVAYVLSHFAIYFVAYIYLRNLDYGWLSINIWHNAQYILFVWLYNNRRFNGKISETQKFLSTISQNGRFLLYIATCLTLSTLVYYVFTSILTDAVSKIFSLTITMSVLVIYQTLNFHHYIVDSLIWKLRKPKIQRNLGIN
ncbi:MAG: hypothetical protein HKN70_03185 [Gammaproteobacteria bacterium]|nr:hypothetical protein [Gammaproteobacteria bacterium]